MTIMEIQFKDRLKMARKNANMTQTQLAEAVGTSQGSISDLESGRNKTTGLKIKIAEVLGVDPVWLEHGKGKMINKPTLEELKAKIQKIESKSNKNKELVEVDLFLGRNTIPVISWVAAGSWTECQPVTMNEVMEELPRPMIMNECCFALKIRGESMMPEFRPDDYIYVDPNYGFYDLRSGDLVVVMENEKNEATFKQLILGETAEDMYLRPLNPEWPEQRMVPKSEWHLIGKVVGKWTKF